MSDLWEPQSAPENVIRTNSFRYAVADLATAVELRPLVDRQPTSVAVTLLAQKQPRELLHVGPWLIRLSKAEQIEAVLEGYHQDVPWGYFLDSTFDIFSLRQSLRYFNLVRIEPEQKDVLFRYWDPRVMQVFLEVATQHQRKRLFEVIDRIDIGPFSYDAKTNARGGA